MVEALDAKIENEVRLLEKSGVIPCLATVRVGNPDESAHEWGAMRRGERAGLVVRRFALPADGSQEALLEVLAELAGDPTVHGCLLFQPLPSHLDGSAVRAAIPPEKDVAGITDRSLAGAFFPRTKGFPSCTARACLEILDYYGCPLEGRHAVVIGACPSGKHTATLLLRRGAVVTVCGRAEDARTKALCREADILIIATEGSGAVGATHFAPGQVVIDCSIHMDADGTLTGNADFTAAGKIVGAVTPVPGGVGTVVTSVLIHHVVEAARRQLESKSPVL